jgi:hypothetical protein
MRYNSSMEGGVKNVLTDHESVSKKRHARPAGRSFWQNSSAMNSPAMQPLREGILDPVLFADYTTLSVPVKCGPKKTGQVYAFFHKSHMDSRLADTGLYQDLLKDYIEKKKWIASEKKWRESGEAGTEVGLAVAIAMMIECGDYANFLKKFKDDNFEMHPMEHVLLVVEEGKYYHILPVEDLCAFRTAEQVGIMAYSILCALRARLNGTVDEQIRKIAIDWITEHGKMAMDWINDKDESNLNASAFRKLLETKEKGGCLVEQLEGETFQKCLIFDGLLQEVKKKAKTEFKFEDVVELEKVAEACETQTADGEEKQGTQDTSVPKQGIQKEQVPAELCPA